MIVVKMENKSQQPITVQSHKLSEANTLQTVLDVVRTYTQSFHERERVKFKVACLFRRQSLSGQQAPIYLTDDCCLMSDSTPRSVRSADVPTCVVPRTLSSYGDKTFAAAGPRL